MTKGPLEPFKIGVRAQDIQTSVQDVDLGYLSAETKNIRLVGMAERLAIHIRGADVIKDRRKLEYIASQLGIDSLLVPTVLNVLEGLEWVTVDTSGKVEESVPYFSNIYEKAGEYFTTLPRSEIEDATIVVCDALSLAPATEEELKRATGLDHDEFQMVLDIGQSGKFIVHYESEDIKEKVLYSPLYWVEHPDKVEELYKLLKRFGADKVYSALTRIKGYQGLPLSQDTIGGQKESLSEEEMIFAEMVRRGIVLAPVVKSLKGPRNFAFTPSAGISLADKIILEKAMAILSCMRYGQHFGSVTKLDNLEMFIDNLLTSPHRTKKPHSEVKAQYALLVGRGIGKVFPSKQFPNRYYFELVPTKENLQALRLAKDLLKVGEAVHGRGLSEELQKVLLYPGTYEEAMRTLPRMREPGVISGQTYQRILDQMMDKLRGGSV